MTTVKIEPGEIMAMCKAIFTIDGKEQIVPLLTGGPSQKFKICVSPDRKKFALIRYYDIPSVTNIDLIVKNMETNWSNDYSTDYIDVSSVSFNQTSTHLAYLINPNKYTFNIYTRRPCTYEENHASKKKIVLINTNSYPTYKANEINNSISYQWNDTGDKILCSDGQNTSVYSLPDACLGLKMCSEGTVKNTV